MGRLPFGVYPIEGDFQAVFLGLDLERAAFWRRTWAVFRLGHIQCPSPNLTVSSPSCSVQN